MAAEVVPEVLRLVDQLDRSVLQLLEHLPGSTSSPKEIDVAAVQGE